jgi:hypothetical protein
VGKQKKGRRKPPRRKKPRSVDREPAAQTIVRSDASEALLRRLRSLRVVCGPQEHPADVAVCRPEETDHREAAWSEDVDRVREALQAVAQGEDARARQSLQSLPRKSPLSPWRLLVAGLIDWYAGAAERAAAAWDRIDPHRRPGRIAAALRAGQAFQHREQGSTSLDRRAALVHALRCGRPALAEARQATRRASTETVTSDQLTWFRQWQAAWRESEPELVAAVGRNLLVVAMEQPDNQLVDELARRVPGPLHDPANCLPLMKYYDNFVDGDEQIETIKLRYLRQDLPACATLSEPVKRALASTLHYREAGDLAGELQRRRNFLFAALRGGYSAAAEELRQQADRGYRAAIEAYPAHRAAHRDRLRLLQQSPPGRGETKADEQAQQERVAEAMECWARSLPEDIEPRRWLVHFYLEEDRPDEAAPHVEMLQRQRLTDPWGRALAWRLALFAAMSLARRKRAVGQAEAKLEEAAARWPAWLDRDWVPFLQAALAWRAGDEARFTALRAQAEEAVGEFPLLRQVMLYAAARRVHLPNPQVKPLRDSLTRTVKEAWSLAPRDLLKTGSFLWDLERIGALYPGYRTHAGKICSGLCRWLIDSEGGLENESLGPAALWMAGRRFGADSGHTLVLPLLEKQIKSDPLVAAAFLREFSERRYPVDPEQYELDAFAMLQERADAIEDPFYRDYTKDLLEKTQWIGQCAAESSRPGTRFGPDELEFRFEDSEDDEEPCDCFDCRRERGELTDEEVRSLENEGPPPPELIDLFRQMAEAIGLDFDPDLVDEEEPTPSRRSGSRPRGKTKKARSKSRK